MPRNAQHYLEYMRRHAAEFVTVRRQIHQNPELGFEEFGTSDLVAGRLEAWGYEVERGLGVTGLVGRLKRGSGTRSIGIRADMDALPIEEKTGSRTAAEGPASCMPAAMTATRPCCSARRSTWRSTASSRAR